VTKRPRRVRIDAHAKLNLGLVVGPRRPDGFHDLATVFQSISLADTLVAERAARGFTLAVRHESAAIAGRPVRDRVPAGRANLAIRAARLVHERLGLAGGVRMRLTKRIPAQAGLGGGSADAAAAIAAVLALHGVRVARERRIALAAELGSDVPFAITGGTAVATGRGERLRRARLERPFEALLAIPRWRISTAVAFARLDKARYGLTGWRANLRMLASLGRKRVTASCSDRLGNSFERVLGNHRQDFEALRRRMRAAGVLQPHLTGSGSGVFGILPEGKPAREAAGRFTGSESLYMVRSTGRGLKLRSQP
jgi:4-diphosphocytidyl-2-C-methyl-D-erythritol kinase